MKVTITSDGLTRNTFVRDESGDEIKIALKRIEIDADDGIVIARLTPLVTGMVITADAQFDMLHEGKLKFIKRVEFRDGTEWVPKA